MKTVVLILFLSVGYSIKAQDVVVWEFSSKKIADKIYEVHFTPKVQFPWHIYSLRVNDARALPTSFSFKKNPLVIIDGKINEVGLQENFIQVVKLKSNAKTKLAGEVEFMACKDEQCLPPQTISFNIPLQ